MSIGEKHDRNEDCTDHSLKPIADKAVKGVTVDEYSGLLDLCLDQKIISKTDQQELRAALDKEDRALRIVLNIDRRHVTEDHVRQYQNFTERGGTPDTATKQFAVEWVIAHGIANHRMRPAQEAHRRGDTEEYWRLLVPILSRALDEPTDPLHFYALVIFVTPAYMNQTGQDIPFLKSRSFGEVVEKNTVRVALKTAYARRAEEELRPVCDGRKKGGKAKVEKNAQRFRIRAEDIRTSKKSVAALAKHYKISPRHVRRIKADT